MNRFLTSLFLLCGPLLSASESPMLARPAAVLLKGDLGIEVAARQFNRAYWLDRNGELAQSYGMMDSDGFIKSVKGFQFDLKILWAMSSGGVLEISLPYYNQEFSPASTTPWQPGVLGDPKVRSADASGDLALGWRGLVLGEPRGIWKASAGIECSAPTGQGPFASAHPLVATGNGGFVAAAHLHLAAATDAVGGWLQARTPHEFGYSADVAPGAFVAYQRNLATQTLTGGRSWVSRSLSYDLIAGFAWAWHRDPSTRHSLALELQFDERGALRLDGTEIPGSASSALNVLPQARFSFGKSMAVNFAWLTPLGYVSNRPVAYWGELFLRVDYTL